jgi:hypothetical protein
MNEAVCHGRGGDKWALRELIIECKLNFTDEGLSILRDTREKCTHWPELRKDLDEAIEAWQHVATTPSANSSKSALPAQAFRASQFGDMWCVLFAPGCEVKGLCALCASRTIADDVIRSINALPPNTEICVSIKNHGDGDEVIPCVVFLLRDSNGSKAGALDWFDQSVRKTSAPKRCDDAIESGYCPLLDLSTIQKYFPSSRPYPRSLKEMQKAL